ncbi:LysM peptidoglycan-binding domain-containing protein [Microbacterium sp. LRZ72]|uniref:LysM peptidoglycan-binding domain-containing protein n=1 Tax=Microbacterium sp. LRZ72 TaxID=2942481 RepID=UPI0039AF940E
MPAALMGTLTATLTAAPAQAEQSRDAPAPHAFPRSAPASTVPDDYVVAPGDTVWSIAASFGLGVADVLRWNGLDRSSVIHPGLSLSLRGPAAAAPHESTPKPRDPVTHTVAAGETLTAIAARHDSDLSTLFEANGLDWSSVIYPGQQLTIPGGSASSGDAAADDGTEPSADAPSDDRGSADAASVQHTVVGGDTLWAIARDHGVSLAALYTANDIGPGSIIYPGQTLTVPGASSPEGGDGDDAAAAEPVRAVTPTIEQAETQLDAQQRDNARLIIRVGRELGVPDKGIAIALATAMVESWIRNLDWGDRDSLGLFQQRPSTGWGTVEQVQDAERAVRVFYGGSSDPNGDRTRGLLDIAGWQGMGFAEAAQAVQISAFPERYAEWETAAHAWLAELG